MSISDLDTFLFWLDIVIGIFDTVFVMTVGDIAEFIGPPPPRITPDVDQLPEFVLFGCCILPIAKREK